MWGLIVLAQEKGRDPFREPEVIWGTAGLAVALLVGALLVYLADRWRKRQAASVADAAGELTDFRAMFERGEITEQEYARLRDRVARRVKVPAPETVLPPRNAPATTPNAPETAPTPNQTLPPTDSGNPANPSSPA